MAATCPTIPAARNATDIAPTAQFAEHGLDGTTVERIARHAGINKERLYNYFGDKAQLFALVLATQLNELAAAVPLEEIQEPADVGRYASAVFDYHQEHPQLSRLLLWEGLAGLAEVPDEDTRSGYYARKVATFAAAQAQGRIDDTLPAADLAFLVIALAVWWHAVPQMARMLHAGQPQDIGPRDSIATAATKLATP